MDRTRWLLAAAFVAASGAACPARASGISVARFGAEHGHPTTDNATAIFYNPAGIAQSEGGHVYIDATVAWRRATYERPADFRDDPVPAGGEGANTGRASLLNFPFSPMAGVTYELGDLALGLAAYTPYGGQSTWDENEAFAESLAFPGAIDGVQRWYSITGEIRSSYLSLAAAYAFGPVSVGLSANLIWSVVDTIRAREPVGGNNLRNEGRSWLDASGFDPSVGAGVVYEVLRRELWLGASYQSRPNLTGGIRMGGELTTVFVNGSRQENSVDFHTDLPDVYRLGSRYRPRPDIELRLFGDYQRWSVLDHQCVSPRGEDCEVLADGSAAPGSTVIQNQVRDWNDTFGVRGGTSYWIDPEIELFGGAGYSSNAVPDETLEPALMDFNAISIAAGARFELSSNIHLAASYTQLVYLSRDTTGQSIHPDLRGPANVSSPSRNPASGGRYAQQVGVLNTNVDFAF